MMTTTLALLVLTAEPAKANPGLAVMDFAVEGASPELGAATSGLVSHELERLGVFRVNSAETTRVILGVERQRQLLGCENCSGNTISELTSFEYLVTGKLTRTGGPKEPKYLLLMTLLQTGSSSPMSSVRVEAKGEEKLLQEVGPAVTKLIGKIMAGRQGALVVSSTEVGAAVKVDDTQVGTTPLDGRVPVAAGPHLLTVEKDGFSAVKKEVRVTPDQVSDEYIRLVPSPDTIESYESRAKRTRILAWVAAGLGVAGAGAFVAGTAVANQEYGASDSQEGSFLFYRAALLRGEETSADGSQNYRTLAGQKKATVELMQTISWIGIATAAAGAIGATVLFVVGDPPGKYDGYRTRTQVSVTLSPSPGGAVLSGSF